MSYWSKDSSREEKIEKKIEKKILRLVDENRWIACVNSILKMPRVGFMMISHISRPFPHQKCLHAKFPRNIDENKNVEKCWNFKVLTPFRA